MLVSSCPEVIILCCPITQILPAGPLSLLISFSNSLLLSYLHSPFLPPHCFFSQNREDKEGKKGSKKAYLENAFTYQTNLGRKPSEKGKDQKVSITSYESPVKFHTEQRGKGCMSFIVVVFHGGKQIQKYSGYLGKSSHSPPEKESLRKGWCKKVNAHPS